MDALAIFALIEKGITVAELLIATGKSAAPAFTVVKDLLTGAQAGGVTDTELAATEETLDGMISDFNEPMT